MRHGERFAGTFRESRRAVDRVDVKTGDHVATDLTTFVEAPTAIEVTIPADTQPIGAVAGIEVSPSLHAHLTEAVVRIAGPSYNLDEGLGYLVLLADEYEPLRRAAEADAARSRSYAEVTAA